MKTLRIVNKENRCSYVERNIFRKFWVRVSPYYTSSIEAYNWVRRCKEYNLVKK